MTKIKHKEASTSVGEEVDSIEWASENIHELVGGGETITSNPPSGYCVVTNIYVNPTTGKTVVRYDNTPV